MKKHVLRPLWLALGLIALVLVVRHFMVPKDFGVHGRNFTYGYFRLGAIDDWRNVPVKYRGREQCQECHADRATENRDGSHAGIECENCHGPALAHPDNPAKLTIDRSRSLCLRCHGRLAYPGSLRGELPGIDPAGHNPDGQCRECHNPHHPDLEERQ